MVIIILKRTLVFFIAFTTLTNTAFAWEEFTGKVTRVEPTYMPNKIRFTMDIGDKECPAENFLDWQKEDKDNNKAVYAGLLAAMFAGKPVRIYRSDNDKTCEVRYVHILAN